MKTKPTPAARRQTAVVAALRIQNAFTSAP